MSNKALIIIDIQNEYFEGGALELENPVAASLNAKKVLTYFRENKLPVIHVQHLSGDPQGQIFIPGTPGAALHENVLPLEDEKHITKHYPNSFRDTDLLEYLHGQQVEEVVIVGMMTHMCVDATVRAAKDFGFECTVISDACATMDLEFEGRKVKAQDVHSSFLAALAFFYAKIQTAAQLMD